MRALEVVNDHAVAGVRDPEQRDQQRQMAVPPVHNSPRVPLVPATPRHTPHAAQTILRLLGVKAHESVFSSLFG